VDCGVGGVAEASIWQVGGDDTWAKGGSRALQAGERWMGRIKCVGFCGPKVNFSEWLEALTFIYLLLYYAML